MESFTVKFFESKKLSSNFQTNKKNWERKFRFGIFGNKI